jgi:hypothetical protein
MRWVMQSLANYRWAVRLGLALAGEHARRYGGVHKAQGVLEWLLDHEPALPDIGATPFIPSNLGEYLVPGNPVESYRRYYAGGKRAFAEWPEDEMPEWFSR